MNRLAHLLRRGAVLAIPLALLAPSAAQGADTIVVGLRPGAVVATALSASGAVQVGAVPKLRAIVVRLPATRRSAALRALRRSRAVRYAEPQRRLRALETPQPDPGRAQQWGLDAVGIGGAWLVTRGAGVVVAVVDTGVAPAPDLAGRLLPGWNVIDGSDAPADDNGHGTHVAGTIAEVEGNGLAEAGVAPEASILPVKVLDAEGTGSDADVAAGIVWAADHGARVVNLSLGGGESSTVLADAVVYARHRDVLIVAAAGNDGGAWGFPPGSRACSPSAPWTSRSCALRSVPAAGRSTSSRPASASSSRRSTRRVATPTGRSRAPRWRRRTSPASRLSRSRPGARRRRRALPGC